MTTEYKILPFDVNDNLVPTVLQGSQGCPNLVALHNMYAILNSSGSARSGKFTENSMKSILNSMLLEHIEKLGGISVDQVEEVKDVLAHIQSRFSLQPRLSGHLDFVNNASYLLCCLLKLTVLHGWVISPEDSNYDFLREFSYSDLMEYSLELKDEDDQLTTCQSLLNDSSSQLTSYGFESLSAELSDDCLALLFCRNRLDVIHKHKDALFIYVTDEDIRRQSPQATWMLFEKDGEKNIYFTEKYTPVIGQKHIQKAVEWYKRFMLNRSEDNEPREDAQSDDATRESSASTGILTTGCSQEVKKLLPQQEQSVKVAAESSETSASTGILATENVQEVKKLLPQQEQSVNVAVESLESSASTGILATENVEDKSDKQATENVEDKSDEQTSEDDKRAEADDSDHSNITASQDGVPEGVASDFLEFLDNFKDNGCPEYYFQGIVAAFASHKPLFYVPYDFIMADNKLLALKIRDNYSRIYEDLKKAVVFYLSKNQVNAPDAVLKILGLPDSGSVQCFQDFVDTIVLHEHYAVHGECSEALPSYDSRRMGLGYLSCIVAKFKTGRCWAGKWSEANMKVKNKGSEFVIELEEDCKLEADLGYLDLIKFCETVLNRLKYDGKFLPYFDDLAQDHMLINDCFGNPEKWERFLELISYPWALKPPLVRASFICNVYIVGDANSSGDPPSYFPLSSRKNCVEWRRLASGHQLLKNVYEYQNGRKSMKYKYLIDNWSAKHWHVFKFCRHFIQHALGYTKGEDLIQKIGDISVLEILLSRTISKAIAASVRFLVLNCGIDGLFSSSWRHYVGSDYVDKPKLEDATVDMVVQELVDSICEQQMISGDMYTEIAMYKEPGHVSYIFGEADLLHIQDFLNSNQFKFELNEGRLCCGSIVLRKHIYRRTKESDESTFIVMQGPYSAEYNSVYFLLTDFLEMLMNIH